MIFMWGGCTGGPCHPSRWEWSLSKPRALSPTTPFCLQSTLLCLLLAEEFSNFFVIFRPAVAVGKGMCLSPTSHIKGEPWVWWALVPYTSWFNLYSVSNSLLGHRASSFLFHVLLTTVSTVSCGYLLKGFTNLNPFLRNHETLCSIVCSDVFGVRYTWFWVLANHFLVMWTWPFYRTNLCFH